MRAIESTNAVRACLFVGIVTVGCVERYERLEPTVQTSAVADGVTFDYAYVGPSTGILRPEPGQTAPLLRPTQVSPELAVGQFAEALQVGPLTRLPRDSIRRISRFGAGDHRIEVSEDGALIRYHNGTVLEREATAEPPTRERSLALAQVLLDRLDAKGVLQRSEVLSADAVVSYTYKQEGPGGSPGETFRGPLPARKVNTRVKYYRAVHGIPVSGSFVKVVFADSEEVAILEVAWRPVLADATSGGSSTVTIGKDDARAMFERSLNAESLAPGSRVKVLVEELVYDDSEPLDAVNFLEPGFLFIYIVRTPKLGSVDEFVVSKKLHRFFPVTKHGESKWPSQVAARRAAMPPLSKRLQ